ncbi:hypothetical protein [Leptospira harrisiae]|uniref:Lipoprotein n=1 Tax=Leptospira harrisiae TaxID=2023189 RepID=A0A2N0AKZ1_9LEPT|nr:hypothetical protein [Leptospira harrisiae]PJZ84945.1 hypothetical protein CH364_01320 [Leptospira harrisiae]PKA08448.1 hypothetical protein CH366_01320 [Leptospira harrisiae]
MNQFIKSTMVLSFTAIGFISCASGGIELLKEKPIKSFVKNGIETTLKGLEATQMNRDFVDIEVNLRFKNLTNQYVHIQLCQYDFPLNDYNLEYGLKNKGLWETYKKTPELFDTKFWTANSGIKINSLPVIDKPFYYRLYINNKDGKVNQSYDRNTNQQFIKPSEYPEAFTLSAGCNGENRSFIRNEYEKSTDWIAPNSTYNLKLHHSLIRGTKPILLKHPDYFEFELDIDPIR